MFPHPFGFDQFRVDPDLHRLLDERRPLRRTAPGPLRLIDAGQPFTRHHPPLDHRSDGATLYDLARDPRFARNAGMVPRRGLRLWLGQMLLWIGWALIRPRRTG